MTKHRNKKYPFFFLIDDGGFNYALAPLKKGKITLNNYENILKIAKKFNLKIPICFTMKYLDKKNLSGQSQVLDYIDELIDLLKNNQQYLEIGYHGLTHEYQGQQGEFFCLSKNQPVPLAIQKQHFIKSKNIFDFWQLPFPQIFVPPDHAWQLGVTDKLASEFGVKYLISCQKMVFQNHHYQWQNSSWLKFLPRKSLGLNSNDFYLNPKQIRYLRFFPPKNLLDFVKSCIIPQGFLNRVRIHKTLFNQPTHSYITHIGNFSQASLQFWSQLLHLVSHNPHLHICQSNQEAVSYFDKLIN